MADVSTASTSGPEKAPEGQSVGGAVVAPSREGVVATALLELTAYQLKPLSFTFTMPPPEDYYFVRKDQIDGLMGASNDRYFDVGLASGGAAFALLQNLITSILELHNAKVPTTLDWSLAFVCVALGVVAFITLYQGWGRKKPADDVKDKVMSGQKAVVKNE
jgi:hypothetical protein